MIMSQKMRRPAPVWQWEQALIDAYYDHRWHDVLDPLYEKFERWQAGELSHDDIDEAIHQTHKQTRKLYTLFTEKRSFLVRLIQWDAAWFDEWVKDHPPPPGVELAPRPEPLDQDVDDQDVDDRRDGDGA